MTKKEQLYVENLEHQIRCAKALKFTSKIKPDLMPPEDYDTIIKGYVFNIYTQTVSCACTSSISHSIGNDVEPRCKNSIALYSTKKLAFMALRHELELSFADQLQKVDSEIEKL